MHPCRGDKDSWLNPPNVAIVFGKGCSYHFICLAPMLVFTGSALQTAAAALHLLDDALLLQTGP